ncbi:MAG: S8 family serine peptidase [Gaiella sp.]
MRKAHGGTTGTRGNALWGGKGGRRGRLPVFVTFLIAMFALVAGTASPSPAGKGGPEVNRGVEGQAFVPPGLLAAAQGSPDATFKVIVQVRSNGNTDGAKLLEKAMKDRPGKAKGLKRRFAELGTIAADVTGAQLVNLAESRRVFSITEDAPVASTHANDQQWVGSTEILENSTNPWTTTKSFPTIAIVDSGIESRTDFGNRLLASATFVSAGINSPGDGYGHGTLVAGMAAGSTSGKTGVAPTAKLVSLDVLDDNGMGRISDVIAACEWILANKAQYNIRVANFSLNAGGGASVLFDPLNHAVEKLWLNGVVVVASAGNYGTGSTPTGVKFSPANDPFVITVGASDVNGNDWNDDDFAAPWSAWGYTYDGFFKPEISAPGRRITSSVPAGSKLAAEFSGRRSGSNYMWMSGTSFAAPIVAGTAAYFLALNPSWTPDQVKGALMLDADVPDGYNGRGPLGVGVLDGDGNVGTTSPPNPNQALHQFVTTDATGKKVFNAASWSSAARASASWSSASWSSASWSSASWSSASWASTSQADASWASGIGVE